MRFVTFRRGGAIPEPGVLKGTKVISLKSLGYDDLIEVIEDWDDARPQIEALLNNAMADAFDDLSATNLTAPILRPNKLLCVGLNYRDHAIESGMEIPKVPTIFNKFATSIIGPGEKIVLPKKSEKPDYEAEFAVVIGKGGRHIAEDKWQEHVFGYTILNDVSARDYQLATTQWLMGKTFDTFAPMGPALVTADEISDPHNLDIKMTIGGEVLQNSNTKHLIFRIPDLISYISSVCTLEPGDVISTGTPAGVGLGFKPPRWLKPGDECVITVQEIGELRNPCVLEA
jgi:2-keto-4-pentenoate hydratase/2-oxohepta-3-ene-1,7-dioic acid hydratase in catechol pathway